MTAADKVAAGKSPVGEAAVEEAATGEGAVGEAATGESAVGEAATGESAARDQALTLLPAVDVADGQAVRLVQGAAGTETRYGDPVSAAMAWQRAGAQWIHLVDLDAAFGRGSNAALLASAIRQLHAAVELSGGIRDDTSLAAALATGCERVVIGTAALENPEWVRGVIAAHGERIAVGLDVRGTRLDRGRRRAPRRAGPAGGGRLPEGRGHRCRQRRHPRRAQP